MGFCHRFDRDARRHRPRRVGRIDAWAFAGTASRPAPRRGARHAPRELGMGFCRRRALRRPGVVRGSGAAGSGLRVVPGEPSGRVWQARQQAIRNHRCTPMHTDGPEPGRVVHSRSPTTEPGKPCRCGGHCPIRVHRCASVVPDFLLCRTQHRSAWQRHGTAPHLAVARRASRRMGCFLATASRPLWRVAGE